MRTPVLFSLTIIILYSTSVFAAGQPDLTTKKGTRQVEKRLSKSTSVPLVCDRCIRAHMDFLASDALRGRGSATPDEHVAAIYIASELTQYGIKPAGDDGGYLQKVPLVRRKFSGPPHLNFSDNGDVDWKHGAEFLALKVGADQLTGPLQKIDLAAANPVKPQDGAFVLLTRSNGKVPGYQEGESLAETGAAAVLIPESPGIQAHWQSIADRLLAGTLQLASSEGKISHKPTLIVLNEAAVKRLSQIPDGTEIKFSATEAPQEAAFTWNVIGKIEGKGASLKNSVILLTAHLDHLGVGKPVNGDDIYNGADDDASGTTAVLEIARILGKAPRPARTVLFALFGSEELGGLGSNYFLDHPPVPLKQIAANLEFEMIGRGDPTVKPDQLWLTGWKRSNLGPTLAAHGAKLVGDPHPDQNFFARSDNYALAERGVVAQTVSSFGLHPDYHQPSDDLAHINFQHMDAAIGSMLRPIEWLVNSSFRPAWNPGGQP